MKNNILAFILSLLAFNLTNAQSFNERIDLETIKSSKVKTKPINNKATGDTLWYEDFAGGLPSCWSVVNNSPNNFQWQWDTLYRAGMWTQAVTRINSSTASNGFMLLPMDFYNTPASGMNIVMDTYFQSCAIPLTPKPNVELRLQQFYRFCCTSNSSAIIQVSTDSFATFTQYDLNSRSPWNSSPNVENISINVSSVLANSSVAYLRVYLTGLSHYFWMIDDIALVEGPGQELSNVNLTSGTSYMYDPFLTLQPLLHARNIGFRANVQNVTGSTITGTNLDIEVYHTNSPSGSNQVYSNTASINGNGVLAPFEVDTVLVNSPAFFPSQKGNYRTDFRASSTQYPIPDSASYTFSIGDTVFARDNDSSGSRTGPSRFVDGNSVPGGTADGDRMGLLFNIDSLSGVNTTFSSISMFVSPDSTNIGSVIRPVIWEYNENNLTSTINSAFGREVASSSQGYTITANQLNSWQTFTIDTGLNFMRNNNHGQFVVGWEMIGGTSGGSKFTVGNDISALVNSPILSCFLGFGHDTSNSWGWALAVPMIRLNSSSLLVGIHEAQPSENHFAIHPNPSKDIFRFSVSEKIKNLRVYDVNGRLIINRENSIENEIDLRGREKGIYFIKIETEKGRVLSRKVMLN